MKFKVIREHLGDKMYKVGDIREADKHNVTHLLKRGILVAVTSIPDAEHDGVAVVSVSDDQVNANTVSDDAVQSEETGKEPSLNKKSEPVKNDGDSKNKAEPAAPKNKGQ